MVNKKFFVSFFFFSFFLSHISFGMQAYIGRSLNFRIPENSIIETEKGFELGLKKNFNKSSFVAVNLSLSSFDEESTRLIVSKQESLAIDGLFGVSFFNKIKVQVSSGLGFMAERTSMSFVGNRQQVDQYSMRLPAALAFEYSVTSKVHFSILGRVFMKCSEILSKTISFYNKIHYNMAFAMGLTF